MAKPGPVQRPERLEAGKALRQEVPRAWHAAWEPAPDRRDPIAILEEQAESRLPDLIPIRHGRMVVVAVRASSAGAAAVMAADLATTPEHRHPGAGVRRRPPRELRHLRHARAAPRVRRQRLRRDPARARGSGTSSGSAPASRWPAGRTAATATTATPRSCSAVGAYRERMYELATMRTLDLWYSRVDVDEILTHGRRPWRPSRSVAWPRRPSPRPAPTTRCAAVAKLTEVVDGQRRIVDHPPLIDHVALANAADQIRMLYEGYLASLSPELQTADEPLRAGRRGPQGRRRRQRRHPLLDRPVRGRRRRRPAAAADQGGPAVGARARAAHRLDLPQPRRAGRARPAADAGGQRPVPRLVDSTRPPASTTTGASCTT